MTRENDAKTRCCGGCEHFRHRTKTTGFCSVPVPFWAIDAAQFVAMRNNNEWSLKIKQGTNCILYTPKTIEQATKKTSDLMKGE